MTGQGVPADRASLLLGMFRAARRGEFATTGPFLGDLLRRPVTPLRSTLERLTAPR
jgi:NAD(P)H dehydrogenase (quinone)